jgi:hypothetical protein
MMQANCTGCSSTFNTLLFDWAHTNGSTVPCGLASSHTRSEPPRPQKCRFRSMHGLLLTRHTADDAAAVLAEASPVCWQAQLRPSSMSGLHCGTCKSQLSLQLPFPAHCCCCCCCGSGGDEDFADAPAGVAPVAVSCSLAVRNKNGQARSAAAASSDLRRLSPSNELRWLLVPGASSES